MQAIKGRAMALAMVLAAGSLIATACDVGGQSAHTRRIAERIFRLPRHERVAAFEELDLRTAYGVYLYGMRYREPPAMELIPPLARFGDSLAVLMRERLDRADSDETEIRDAVSALAFCDVSGTYPVGRDSLLVAVLRRRIASMKDPDWRRYCDSTLAEMRRPPDTARATDRVGVRGAVVAACAVPGAHQVCGARQSRSRPE